MCGIVGIALGPKADRIGIEAVRRMAAAIVHRGPDDEGYYASQHLVFGMRRLSIIDLSGGHQPIANEDASLQLVCNGEIYNFQALRERLLQQGHRFRTGSDVEVLLHLHEQYGDSFLEHVSGMYAAALWDERRARLTLARDRMGQKPLYYVEAGGCLAFASEIKSLLELPFVRAEIDKDALRDYLGMGYATSPRTLFRGIRKLPPATRLVWENGALRLDRYWAIASHTNQTLNESQWLECIRDGLDRAVREHMVSDVPIGAFLSGGIDSSAIVALMSRYSDRPVNTYSIGYSGSAGADYYNELSYAATVAKQFNTRHTEIPVQPDIVELLPKLLWHVEEPISDSAIVTTYLVSELASREVKVILSGVGGDELFGGYTRYLGGHYLTHYNRIPRWIRNGLLRPLAAHLPSGRQSRLMDLARYARRFIEASDLPWQQRYRLYTEICSRQQLGALLDTEAGRDGFDAVSDLQDAPDGLLNLLRLDSQTQLAEDLLLLTDKVTMSTSIECRVPFLDHRLVEMAASIPENLKMRGGELKYLLKRALVGVLPNEILYRRKRGFGAPIGLWFKSELRALRNQLLSPARIARRGLLSPVVVQSMVADHDANRQDYTDLLLSLVNLEIWSCIFIDGRSAADVTAELTELGRRS